MMNTKANALSATQRFTLSLAIILAIPASVFLYSANHETVSAAVKPSAVLLSRIDTDQDGTASREEVMKYMGTEFDKADADHDGTLSPEEVAHFRENILANR